MSPQFSLFGEHKAVRRAQQAPRVVSAPANVNKTDTGKKLGNLGKKVLRLLKHQKPSLKNRDSTRKDHEMHHMLLSVREGVTFKRLYVSVCGDRY